MEAQQEAHASTTENIPYKKQKNTENKTTNVDGRERDVRAFDDMAIASHNIKGEAKWILVRIEDILENAIYRCQCFNTLDGKLRLGRRKYLPVWVDSKDQRNILHLLAQLGHHL